MQEVVCINHSTRSACLSCDPLALSCICIGVFSNIESVIDDFHHVAQRATEMVVRSESTKKLLLPADDALIIVVWTAGFLFILSLIFISRLV